MTRPLSTSALAALLLLGACGEAPTNTDDPSDLDTDEGPLFLYVAPNDPSGVSLPDPIEFDYYIGGQFTIDGMLAGEDGVTYADDPTVICTTGCEDAERTEGSTVLYPVDNAFGYDVADYSDAVPRPRDGVYEEGWIGTLFDGDGAPMGVAISSAETARYKVPGNMGSWCAGLHGDPVKCSTEHYVVLEHVKTCYETIPYWFSDPATGDPLPEHPVCDALVDDDQDIAYGDLYPDENNLDAWSVGSDYGISLKDDGKPLYRFGDTVKKPTDMRVQLTLPLPSEWLDVGAEFVVTRAELAVVHTITNNPNDQIRPEDFENEGATGRKPGYTVDAAGRWVSDKDCFQGDGTFIPAGTVLMNPDFADPTGISSDLREGFTNAWYRSLDRDPFAWDTANGRSPRWRLKAPKMGQDLPGFEIPLENCQPPPLQNGEKKYERGVLTTTTLDLLDFGDAVSPLASSIGWLEPTGQTMQTATLTGTGMTLTEGFDVAVYIKGDQKAVELYSAHLYLDYEPVVP